jgi:PTS system sucrose-specific IIC component
MDFQLTATPHSKFHMFFYDIRLTYSLQYIIPLIGRGCQTGKQPYNGGILMKKMNHKEVAKIIAASLGEGNLVSAAHCATRLRLVLKNADLVDQAALDNCMDIKGTFKADGQYQIIIGPGDVNDVYKELVAITGASAVSTSQAKNEAWDQKKQNPISALIKTLSDIFVPIIPALVAGGLLMALNNVLTAQGLFGPLSLLDRAPWLDGFVSIVNLLAVAPFAFLPILVGISATERFGGNRYLGAAIGMAMVMPQLVNGYGVAEAIANGTMPYWDIFGLKVMQAGYQGMVIPVIGVAFIIANIEKLLHKKIPRSFDFTFTPLISVIVTGFLTFIVIGPFLRIVSDFLTGGIVWLYTSSGFIGSAIFGGLYAPIVITGMHQSFPAIETQLITNILKTGGTFIFPIAAMSNIAQGAATLAIRLTTKDIKQKNLASSASISAMLGITEPAMFGVNLKLKFPFYCALVASAIASSLIGLFDIRAAALGSAGLIGFISIVPKFIPLFLMCCGVSLTISFILTFIVAKKKFAVADNEIGEIPSATVVETTDGGTLIAPLSGKIVAVSELSDPVFAERVLGDGAAILPESDTVLAPADCTVVSIADTYHAYCLETKDGLEILIHIGIDTVKLAGKGFTPLVKEGDKIKAGTAICKVDFAAIKAAGFEIWTPVLITNVDDVSKIIVAEGTAEAGKTAVLSYIRQ